MQLKTDYSKIKEKLTNINKIQNISFEPLLIKYYQNYFDNSHFKDISFEIKPKTIYSCPLTLERKGNQNHSVFMGTFSLFFTLIKKQKYFYFFKKIRSIIESEKIQNIKFYFKKECGEKEINFKIM